jgi:endonuclease/exonuclease/phosphatase (EEP) superfamily protein YafD
MNLKLFLQIFGFVAILLTIFPFIAVDHWSVRVFDFPHLQLTLLTMMALLTYFLKFDIRNIRDYVFVIVLAACFIFQGLKIFPYTAFARYEVLAGTAGANNSISIYTANVFQDNTKTESLTENLKAYDADLVVLTETNEFWRKSLNKSLLNKYAHRVEIPLENTYGMLLFSKFELYDKRVRFLVEDTIPSIHAKLIISSRDTIQLFAIHPAPPTPQHNPSSVDRDAEMMKIARLSRTSNHAVIVLGDFNDVAWSETTSLFQKVSGLLDLRKGRGLFNTYNAKSWIMRWPLDHIFTSPEFRVFEVERGSKVQSDHFPFFTKLSFEPERAEEQQPPPPSPEQLQRAFDQIDNEREEDEKG